MSRPAFKSGWDLLVLPTPLALALLVVAAVPAAMGLKLLVGAMVLVGLALGTVAPLLLPIGVHYGSRNHERADPGAGYLALCVLFPVLSIHYLSKMDGVER